MILAGLRLRARHLVSADGPKLLRDLASLVTGQFASMVVGFVAFAALARRLDPASYGALEFAISVAAFGAMVIDCGVGQIGVREIAKSPGRAPQIAAQVVSARVWLTIPILPLVAASGWASGLQGEAAWLVAIVALSLLAVPVKQDWLLQAHEKMHQAAVAQPLRTGLFALGVVALVGTDTSLATVGWIEVASVAGMAIWYLVAQHVWAVPFRFDWHWTAPFHFLRQGMAVGMANILWAFMLYAPMMLLVALTDGTGAAWLGAAQRLVISLLTLSFLYHFNLFPVITRTVLADREAWGRVMAASTHVVAWGGIGVALAMTLMATEIMTFVYGAGFVAAGPVLMVLAWLFPLRVLTGHGRWSLVASGRQKHLMWGEIAGAITLVAVAFVTIPRWEATGAGLALASGIVVSGIVTQIAVNRLVGPLALLRPLFHPLAAAIAACVAGYGLADGLALRVILGMGVFFGLGAAQVPAFLRNLQRIAYAKESA